MKPEQQRAAIAEACGWRYPGSTDLKFESWKHWIPPLGSHQRTVPDYLNDLNAMHEAEKVLLAQSKINDGESPFHRYFEQLYNLSAGSDAFNEPMKAENWAVCTPASQRAEAFLRAIGKWIEEGTN